ncbi:dihydrolipoyllysine-residue acetyltransferase [Halopseudomonas salegens]|uniref:Acetyltransferase component of pyruvate dehydrogenase complex n=1 Tax=Halopseudomonas salegens TaxID=1434072 RepID=A0A1H2EFW5_9GAMM|nr:dihydrolipoyllysine-residue acetyltransferase [Halopseudomonas salegens]SDT93980.1 pyruvate dehydrogenase E2 component (dihydrolipoamide acetyltransferase) [Halopseudomonas salegens]
MSEAIKVPDIGGGEGEIIEILVKQGDSIAAEDSLLVLESDKASMEVPSPKAGVVKSIKVKIGDTLKEGDVMIELEAEADKDDSASDADEDDTEDKQASSDNKDQDTDKDAEKNQKADNKPEKSKKQSASKSTSDKEKTQEQAIKIPDLGGDSARVIEILVKEGDEIQAEDSVIVLESDKASMEIPSPQAGVVKSIDLKLEQEVKTGDAMLTLSTSAGADDADDAGEDTGDTSDDDQAETAENKDDQPERKASSDSSKDKSADDRDDSTPPPVGGPSREGTKVHAGPAVRKMARELGVDLPEVKPSGPRERILKEDVDGYVKTVMQQRKQAGPAKSGIPPVPEIDFSRFGETEEKPLTRMQQVGAANLHRSWLNVPHVTQFDLADMTELEAFRKAQKTAAEKAGVKLTLLPFLLKACAHLLREMPDFNASLSPDGKALIQKKYVHLGFAVDTPDGLLVPVIRDVDRKSLLDLAGEAAELADKARNKKLGSKDMQGACFTISSLGHIGGTYFTPIVNSPEVAILGVSKASMQPVWDGDSFQPRLMLPLSLSYDHRAINGAAAAQFTRRLGELLADIRSMLL